MTTDIEHEVKSVDIIVSRTDEAGNITYANPIFCKLSGYAQSELLNHPHSIVRHPDMPKIIFKFLWDNIQNGKEVFAYVKNRSKDGGFYWVFANVKVATNPDGIFRSYISTRRHMSTNARAIIEPLYKEMLEAEKQGGMDASLEILKNFLASRNASLETFNETMKEINN